MKRKWRVSGALLLAGILIYGSMRDENPDAGTLAAFDYQPENVPPETNVYYALMGLTADPDTEDFVAAGYMATMDEAPDSNRISASFSDLRYDNPCFSFGKNDCVAKILEDTETIERKLIENEILVERYKAMQQMPYFINTDVSFKTAPTYQPLLNLSALLAAQAGIDIEKGNIEKGLIFFAEDLDFYRKILVSQDAMLVDKMIALVQIKRLNTMLSRLIAGNTKIAVRHADKIGDMLVPLDMPGGLMAEAMTREKIFILKSLNADLNSQTLFETYDPESGTTGQTYGMNFLSPLVFKKNITLNLYNRRFEYLIEAFRTIPMLGYPDQLALIENRHREEIAHRTLFSEYGLFVWKNYIGEALAAMHDPDPFRYLTRAYDTASYTHLVRAQFELALASSRSQNETIPALQQTLGSETFNPYTGQPFDWDEKQQKLWFQPVGEGKPWSISLH